MQLQNEFPYQSNTLKPGKSPVYSYYPSDLGFSSFKRNSIKHKYKTKEYPIKYKSTKYAASPLQYTSSGSGSDLHRLKSSGNFYNQPVNYGPATSSYSASESNYLDQDIGNKYKNIQPPTRDVKKENKTNLIFPESPNYSENVNFIHANSDVSRPMSGPDAYLMQFPVTPEQFRQGI